MTTAPTIPTIPLRYRRLAARPPPDLALPFGEQAGPIALGGACSLVFILPWFGEGPASWAAALQPSALVCAIAVAGYVAVQAVGGSKLGALFGMALVSRLLLCLLFYLLCPKPGTNEEFGISVPTVTVYNDDVHYVGAAEEMLKSNQSGASVVGLDTAMEEKVRRVAWVLFVFKRFLGAEQVWIRLMNCIVGSFTVVIAAWAIKGLLSQRAEKWCVALLCFGPHFMQSSILLYKECYAMLAGAISLYALCCLLRQPSRVISGLFVFAIALAALYWVRRELVVVLAGVGLVAFIVPRFFAVSNTTLLVACCLGVGAFGLLLHDRFELAERAAEQLEEAYGFNSVTFGWANSLPGPARIIHVPISMVNPPPGPLLYLCLHPNPGNGAWFRGCVFELITLQWWIMLPWLLLAPPSQPEGGERVNARKQSSDFERSAPNSFL